MSSLSRALTLSVLAAEYAIVRLAADAEVPQWAVGEFFSVTRTPDELSIVCEAASIPAGELPTAMWRALRAHGPFAFDEIGILASLAAPLASARIGIFVISTFETDYLLVQSKDISGAISALRSAGHRVIEADCPCNDSKENKA